MCKSWLFWSYEIYFCNNFIENDENIKNNIAILFAFVCDRSIRKQDLLPGGKIFFTVRWVWKRILKKISNENWNEYVSPFVREKIGILLQEEMRKNKTGIKRLFARYNLQFNWTKKKHPRCSFFLFNQLG